MPTNPLQNAHVDVVKSTSHTSNNKGKSIMSKLTFADFEI